MTLKIIDNENIELYSCPRCYKKFDFEESVRRHFLKYHENSQAKLQVSRKEKFSCPECEKQFSWVSHVRRHMKAVHEGIRYQCDHCDYTAIQKVHLRRHIKQCQCMSRKNIKSSNINAFIDETIFLISISVRLCWEKISIK